MSKSPAMAEKHRASGRASASCEPTQRWGAFLWLLSLGDKESNSRDSAKKFDAARSVREADGTESVGMRDEAAFPTYAGSGFTDSPN